MGIENFLSYYQSSRDGICGGCFRSRLKIRIFYGKLAGAFLSLPSSHLAVKTVGGIFLSWAGNVCEFMLTACMGAQCCNWRNPTSYSWDWEIRED